MGDRLTIQDGFRFGCGFLAAGCVFEIGVMLLAGLGFAVLTILGLTSLIPQLSNLPR